MSGKIISYTEPVDHHIALVGEWHAKASAAADQAKGYALSAMGLALALGFKLAIIKQCEVAHGEFTGMFAASDEDPESAARFPFTSRTGQKYMKAAAELEKLATKKQRAIFAKVAKCVDGDLGPEFFAAVHELTSAQSTRELYVSLGIIRPTKMEALDDGREKRKDKKKDADADPIDSMRGEAIAEGEKLIALLKVVANAEVTDHLTPDECEALAEQCEQAAETLRNAWKGDL